MVRAEGSDFLEPLLAPELGAFSAVTALAGGRNNRVFKIISSQGTFVAKQFFPSMAGARDRFRSESYFLGRAEEYAEVELIKPLLILKDEELIVSRYFAGQSFRKSASIGREEVEACKDFIRKINHPKLRKDYEIEAAEAAFSSEEHVAILEERMARLQRVELPKEVETLVSSLVIPCWEEARKSFLAKQLPPIGDEQAIISPSDFGFHNMLRDKQGRIKFFDFEYAGRDDPGKLGSDFLLQPRLLVPIKTLLPLLQTLEELQKGSIERVRALLPIFTLKWCCIFLNEFLPNENRRRSFSQGEVNDNARREEQIEKVRGLIERMNTLSKSLDHMQV